MSQQPRPAETGRSTRKVILDVALLICIPSLAIYLISLVWK
jgi:hypothetical protein